MLCGWTQDVNNSGFIFDYEGTGDPQFNTYRELGISTMPTITIYDNLIVVGYASTTETFVTPAGLQNYKHIWIRFSWGLGSNWSFFSDVQSGNIFHIYDECIYPLLAHNPFDYSIYHLLYQADNIPGLFLDEDHDAVTNRLIYNKLNLDINPGIGEEANSGNNNNITTSCYPNPTQGLTQIRVELKQPMNVSVEITNLTGQKVMEIPAKAMQAGSHTLTLDASALGSGVYFYTVKAGNESVTKKMIVE